MASLPTLYEISDELVEIYNRAEENDGELSDEDIERLEISRENEAAKISGYYKFMAVLNNMNDGIDAEVKKLQTKKRTNMNIVNRLKKALVFHLQKTNQHRVQGTDEHFVYMTTTHPVQIDEEVLYSRIQPIIDRVAEELGDCFTVKVEPNKKNIGKHIDEGDHIEGAFRTDNFNAILK